MATLGFNCHGKSRVRMVKVVRRPDGYEEVIQVSVQILLEGEVMGDVFVTGDNATVVATDTCKNTVYCLGKMHDFSAIEEFGVIICKHFLNQYPEMVNRISVEIIKDRWERVHNKDSRGNANVPHKHVFRRLGPNRPFVHTQGTKAYKSGPNGKIGITMQGGFDGLEIMKTTQSGFTGFHRDRFTSLPEVKDRLVGTSVKAIWEYSQKAIGSFRGDDYINTHKIIEDACVNEFAGPADTGIYSNSVQQTAFDMGKASIAQTGQALDHITLELPNIHNIPFDLTRYGFKADPKGESPTIFFPIDEPHGMIKATIHRDGASNNRKHRSKM